MTVKNFMRASDKFAVADMIKKHISKNGNYWVYQDGWSDEVVARKFGRGASEQNVKTVRKAAFGPLLPRPTNGTKKERGNDGRILGHEQRISKLEVVMARICSGLGIDYNG